MLSLAPGTLGVLHGTGELFSLLDTRRICISYLYLSDSLLTFLFHFSMLYNLFLSFTGITIHNLYYKLITMYSTVQWPSTSDQYYIHCSFKNLIFVVIFIANYKLVFYIFQQFFILKKITL